MGKLQKTFFLICFLLFVGGAFPIQAQNDVSIEKEIRPDGKAYVTRITNNGKSDVTITLINETDGASVPFSLKSGESNRPNLVCTLIRYRSNTNGGTLWKMKTSSNANKVTVTDKEDIAVDLVDKELTRDVHPNKVDDGKNKPYLPNKKGPYTSEEVIASFYDYIESIPFYSTAVINRESQLVEEHITNLQNWKDKDAYISQNRLNSYIKMVRDSINTYKDDISTLAFKYLDRYDNNTVKDRESAFQGIRSILEKKISERDYNINKLADEINNSSEQSASNLNGTTGLYIAVCVGLLILAFGLFLWYRKVARKDKKMTAVASPAVSVSNAAPNIIVRRRTTSILKKQSLEDVIDNDAYLKIDSSEFCESSAVRMIFLKNTCIKDIYNMYAEDLRNPNNPNEDGCMVLGRWVHDKEIDEYYVSLEHIVRPGDDAVLSEYELNFGGKIKLKVAEKLKKLRKETQLQYDLTCWVHSHPGLGVFFSNSDTGVHDLLKNEHHPFFLTAIVVDILTPQQEMGIFTFKKDKTINSKTDIKKFYSLEDLYKWAVESERNAFKPEDYFNILANSKVTSDECFAIELSNGSIIDMDKFATEQANGLAGMAYGFAISHGSRKRLVVEEVTTAENVPDHEPNGCFVITTHCSIPSIKKLITPLISKIDFALVYTTSDGLITAIPVSGEDLCTDEKYYGEQKLEDLKIWTRRKR